MRGKIKCTFIQKFSILYTIFMGDVYPANRSCLQWYSQRNPLKINSRDDGVRYKLSLPGCSGRDHLPFGGGGKVLIWSLPLPLSMPVLLGPEQHPALPPGRPHTPGLENQLFPCWPRWWLHRADSLAFQTTPFHLAQKRQESFLFLWDHQLQGWWDLVETERVTREGILGHLCGFPGCRGRVTPVLLECRDPSRALPKHPICRAICTWTAPAPGKAPVPYSESDLRIKCAWGLSPVIF